MNARTDLSNYLDHCLNEAPVLGELGRRTFSLEEVRTIARRHYAEIRTFLDVKLPCRMRLCPHHALVAKGFFWKLYAEEHGGFEANRTHAALFGVFCRAIGITDAELEAEYAQYSLHYEYLLREAPSIEVMVRELAVSFAWESVSGRIATPLAHALTGLQGEVYLGSDDLSYFAEHLEVDEEHSRLALDVLVTYATEPHLLSIARDAIRDTIVTRSPWIL